jgi:site-specific DNA-cytosine methylase
MASLFDGIGGFPLVFSRAGAIPVWASEIEEFPIAVTKVRFPDYEPVYEVQESGLPEEVQAEGRLAPAPGEREEESR